MLVRIKDLHLVVADSEVEVCNSSGGSGGSSGGSGGSGSS